MNNYLTSLFSLEGKTALVTGASRGLGQAIAVGLAEAGADIIGVATSAERLASTCQAVEATGRQFKAFGCDQGNPDSVRALVKALEDERLDTDILINNAGTIRRAPATDYSFEDWRAVVGTNLDGVFLLSREIGKKMTERGSGKIVNIASLLSFFGGITVPCLYCQ